MQHELRSANSKSMNMCSGPTGPREELYTSVGTFTRSHHLSPVDDGQIRILAVTVQDDNVEDMVLSLVPARLSGDRERPFTDITMEYTAISYAWDPRFNVEDNLQVPCTSPVTNQHCLSFNPDGN